LQNLPDRYRFPHREGGLTGFKIGIAHHGDRTVDIHQHVA
jgi:hypothetical protein